MQIKKINFIFDKGSVKYKEDELIYNPPFFGILDGSSGLYDPNIGPKLFKGLTGGQSVVKIVSDLLERAKEVDDLGVIIETANKKVKDFILENSLPLNKSDELPGCVFALVKITVNTVELIQAGDTMAFWQMENGNIGYTRNQLKEYDRKFNKLVEDSMEKSKGDRNKAWNLLLPEHTKQRIKNINKKGGYAFLNGQKELKTYLYKTKIRAGVKLLLLFSDGFIQLAGRNEKELAKNVIKNYSLGGLKLILEKKRLLEKDNILRSHVEYAEASGLALEFN